MLSKRVVAEFDLANPPGAVFVVDDCDVCPLEHAVVADEHVEPDNTEAWKECARVAKHESLKLVLHERRRPEAVVAIAFDQQPIHGYLPLAATSLRAPMSDSRPPHGDGAPRSPSRTACR